MLTQAIVVSAAHILAGRNVVGEGHITQKWHAGGRRRQADLERVDRQPIGRHVVDNQCLNRQQLLAGCCEDHQVVDVADIELDLQFFLHPVIKLVQEDVCEELARQIADRHALGGRRAVHAAFGEQAIKLIVCLEIFCTFVSGNN